MYFKTSGVGVKTLFNKKAVKNKKAAELVDIESYISIKDNVSNTKVGDVSMTSTEVKVKKDTKELMKQLKKSRNK